MPGAIKAMTTDMGADELKPQIRKFINETRKEYPEIYSLYSNRDTITDAFVEDYEIGGFGSIPKLDEGQTMNFLSMPTGAKTRYETDTYQAAFAITRKDKKYNKIDKVNKYIKRLERAFRVTAEQIAAIPFAVSFDSNFKLNDGVSLVNTAHTDLAGNTVSNRSASDTALGPSTLETAAGAFISMKDNNGQPIQIDPKFLLVGSTLSLVAERAVGAANYFAVSGAGGESKPSSADTGVFNVIKKFGMTVITNPYLNVNGGYAWWLIAAKDQHEVQVLWSQAPVDRAFDDNYTEDSVYSMLMEMVSGASTYIGVWGNYGA